MHLLTDRQTNKQINMSDNTTCIGGDNWYVRIHSQHACFQPSSTTAHPSSTNALSGPDCIICSIGNIHEFRPDFYLTNIHDLERLNRKCVLDKSYCKPHGQAKSTLPAAQVLCVGQKIHVIKTRDIVIKLTWIGPTFVSCRE